MNRKGFIHVILIVLIVTVAVVVFGAYRLISHDYNFGEEAFKNKNYDKAIVGYESFIENYSRLANIKPDIYYNLGLSYLAENKIYKASANFSRYLAHKKLEDVIEEKRFLIGTIFVDTQKYYQGIQLLETLPPAGIKVSGPIYPVDLKDYHLAFAEAYFGKMKYDKALGAADKAIQLAANESPQARKAHLIKYLMFEEQGKYDEADNEVLIIREIGSNDLDIFEFLFSYEERLYFLDKDQLEKWENDLENANISNHSKAIHHTILGSFYRNIGEKQKALEHLEKAISFDSDYFPAYYDLSRIYTDLGDFQKALEFNQISLEIDQYHELIRNSIGYSYFNLAVASEYDKDIFAKAEEQLLISLNLDPELKNAHNNLGLVYKELKDYDRAIEAFKTAIKIDSKYKKPYLNIGSTYIDQGNLDMGLSYYQKALELDPYYSLAYLAIGDFYLRQKDFNQSLVNLKKALELDPDEPDIYELLAEAYIGLGQYQSAIDASNKGLKLAPNNASLYISLGNVYRAMGDSKKAEEYLSKGRSLQSKTSYLYHHNLGVEYKFDGKIDEAEEEFKKALELEPKLVDSYIPLSRIYESKYGKDKAIELLEKGIQQNPEALELYDELGMIYKEKGDSKKAIEVFESASTKIQSNSDKKEVIRIYETLGIFYYGERKFDSALMYLNKGVEEDPNHATLYTNLAAVYVELGQFENAITNSRAALKMNPNDAIAHNNLGFSLAQTGKINEAIVEFKKALEIDPNLKIAQENLDNYHKKR